MAKTDFVNTAADGTEVELEVVTYKYDQGNNKWKAYTQGSGGVDLSTAVTWNTVNGVNAIQGPLYLSSMSGDPSPESVTPGTGDIVVPSGGSATIPADYWIWSDSVSDPALIIDIPCTFTNQGVIIGKGGGGDGAGGSTYEHGGGAIQIISAGVTINNESGAFIAGGGGGGEMYRSADTGSGGGGGAGGGRGGGGYNDDFNSVAGGAGGAVNAAGSNGSVGWGGVGIHGRGGGAGGGGGGQRDTTAVNNGQGAGGGGGGRIVSTDPAVAYGGSGGARSGGDATGAAGGAGGSLGNAGANGGAGGGGGWGARGGGVATYDVDGVTYVYGSGGGEGPAIYASITDSDHSVTTGTGTLQRTTTYTLRLINTPSYTQGIWDGTIYGIS